MFSIGDRDDMEFSNPAGRFVVAVAAADAAPPAGCERVAAVAFAVAFAVTDAVHRRPQSIPAGDRGMRRRFRRRRQRHRRGGPLRADRIVVAAGRGRFELSRDVIGLAADNGGGVAGRADAEANRAVECCAVEYRAGHSGVTGTGSIAK